MNLGSSGLQNVNLSSGVVLSGVYLNLPVGDQYTSYRTGDCGWRMQNSAFNPARPSQPAKFAQLDYSLGTNYWWVLKNPLTVGGVSNTLRFVDVDGGQTWSATNNKDKITIDKLTGRGFYRITADLGGAVVWNTAIDNALTFSVVVNGVTYSDFYLGSLEEMQLIFDSISENGPGNIEDPITLATIFNKNGASNEFWSSTTQSNSGGANAYSKGWNPSTYLRGVGKASVFLPFYIFDASNLIS